MLPRLTPQHSFLLAAVIALSGVLLCLWVITSSPWLGVQIGTGPSALGRVESVEPAARDAGLQVGDRVLAFAAPGEPAVALQPWSLISDPDQTGSFDALGGFLAHSNDLYRATRQPATEAHLDDGRVVVLHRQPRPLSSLPPMFWLLAATAVPFLVGAGVWSYRRGDAASRYLLLAGSSFMIMGLSNLLYAYRQPSVDPLTFQLAIYGNRLGALLFFFAHIAIFWVYPRRLGSDRVLRVGLGVVLLVFLNEVTRTVQWPGNVFAFPLVMSFPLIIGLIGVQWRMSRDHPVDRAALSWFVFVMMGGTILVTGLYFLPGLVDAPPMLSLETAYATGIVSYLGLIMAVARYRLFQLGDWWLTAWLWLLGGTSVVLLDIGITYALNLAPAYVIGLSVFLVGWVYFPLRQWLWRRLFWHGKAPTDWLPKELLEAVVSARGEAALRENWKLLLERLFRPLHAFSEPETVAVPRIEEDGLRLLVPQLSGGGSVVLSYRSDGRRLFSPADAGLVSSLLHMAGPAVDVQKERHLATQRERERIMRDLHDDVGARLLTLRHRLREPENAELVRSAMQSLRDTIYSLNRPDGLELDAAAAEWRHEVMERLETRDIALTWQMDDELSGVRLSAAQRANLGRVLREAVSNALRHGEPSRVWVLFRRCNEVLRVEVGSDAPAVDPSGWCPGTGMMSMRRRMEELGGHIRWHSTPEGHVAAVIELPVEPRQPRRAEEVNPAPMQPYQERTSC